MCVCVCLTLSFLDLCVLVLSGPTHSVHLHSPSILFSFCVVPGAAGRNLSPRLCPYGSPHFVRYAILTMRGEVGASSPPLTSIVPKNSTTTEPSKTATESKHQKATTQPKLSSNSLRQKAERKATIRQCSRMQNADSRKETHTKNKPQKLWNAKRVKQGEAKAKAKAGSRQGAESKFKEKARNKRQSQIR